MGFLGMDAGKENKEKRRLQCGTGHRTYAKCGAVMVHQHERLWLLRAGIKRWKKGYGFTQYLAAG